MSHTAELAGRYQNLVRLIAFTENRGYGAAWKQSDADVLGFLDADGTCDANSFAQLCRIMDAENADVALGCRNRGSRTVVAARATYSSPGCCRATGGKFTVILFDLLPEERADYRRFLESQGINFVDCERPELQDKSFRLPDRHPNQKMNALLAEWIEPLQTVPVEGAPGAAKAGT